MAFKSVTQYNEEKYGGTFILPNDGDSKDVIFLYQSVDDVLIADTHYIKTPEYSGYCHCLGRGCPACGKGIRVQTKLFIPIYDIETGNIVFWDRSSRFERQLMDNVILKYPNPSEYVFRITRKGAAGDVNTTYSIMAENHATSPEFYSGICKDLDSSKMYSYLNGNSTPENLADYNAVPRSTVPTPGSYIPSDIPDYNSETVIPDNIVDDSESEGEEPVF